MLSARPQRSVRMRATSTNSGVRSIPLTRQSYIAARYRDEPPKPLPRSENFHSGANTGPHSVFFGRQNPVAMKLVKQMEVTKCGLLRIEALIPEPGFNP